MVFHSWWTGLILPVKMALFGCFLTITGGIIGVSVWNCSGKTPNGVVVSNADECATIGADVLSQGGKAVDAAIAVMLCEDLQIPESTGIGGGFFMTIYNAKTKTVEHLNARETAPAAATENMFKGDPILSSRGIMSVAIPGALAGYHAAYQKYGGGVPWDRLVQPSIRLLEEGIKITEYLTRAIKHYDMDYLLADPGLRSVFINPATSKPYPTGTKYKNHKLLETLKVIAREGGLAFNNGSLTSKVIDEMNSFAGNIITEDDLRNYRVRWEEPIKIDLQDGRKLFSSPLPGSGAILALILNILKEKLSSSDEPLSVHTQQIIVESFKFAYGQRFQLGDDRTPEMNNFVEKILSKEFAQKISKRIRDDKTSQDPNYYGANITKVVEDHGTAHISILAPNGDAVSATSTINYVFGAGLMLTETGIILNNEMDDFSSPEITNEYGVPPSPSNYIRPGRRPVSSMCPSIILDPLGKVEMVIGAAGGTKITTSVALAIVRHLLFNYPIDRAINEQRLHHQLLPMNLVLESTFYDDPDSKELVHGLCDVIKHNCTMSKEYGFSAVTGITRNTKTKKIEAAFDRRRQGETAFLYNNYKIKSPNATNRRF